MYNYDYLRYRGERLGLSLQFSPLYLLRRLPLEMEFIPGQRKREQRERGGNQDSWECPLRHLFGSYCVSLSVGGWRLSLDTSTAVAASPSDPVFVELPSPLSSPPSSADTVVGVSTIRT